VHSFPVGTIVQGPLLQTADGMLYGTTFGGEGTIFRIRTNGSNYSVVHTFGNPPTEGRNPQPPLLDGGDGWIYGTTIYGGYGFGTIFRFNAAGHFMSLFSFKGTNGDNPLPQLAGGSDGRLYGATYNGGASNVGVLYRINRDGTGYEIIRSFVPDDGAGYNPQMGLIAVGSNLVGATPYGGHMGAGTIYTLAPAPAGSVRISAVRDAANGELDLFLSGTTGFVYRIERAQNLAGSNSWSPVIQSVLATEPGLIFTENLGTNSQQFYRARLVP
jgi:uncharacterized repeat protein (TIGR03803 family)